MLFNLNKLCGIFTILYMVVSMVFPRSYILFKIPVLFIFIFSSFVLLFKNKKFFLNLKIYIFYMSLILFGVIWSLIGFFNGGSLIGITDNFRLWVIWSVFYFIIIILLIQRDSLILIHKSILISSFFIFSINLLGILNFYYNWNILSESFVDELDLKVGFHDGYVQLTTQNIGSLFFIIPYLISLQFRKEVFKLNNKYTKISLLLSLTIAIFSGRRALWLCIFLTPILILVYSLLQQNFSQIKKNYRKFIFVQLFFGSFVLFGIFQTDVFDSPTITHLKNAFSAEDERSIQKSYLLDGFENYTIFGSGFGVGAGYVRNDKAPWLYELTYHQILFNFGIVGSLLILILILVYIILIIENINFYKDNSIIPFSILIGITSFAVGAYSNPYFGSFDFLIYISMLPYLATLNIYQKDNFV